MNGSRALRALRSLLGRLLGALFFGGAGNPSPRRRMDGFDPTKPAVPVSFPIEDLPSLASRSYFASFHYPFNRASVPLPASAAVGMPPRRRLLVCHDMAGGYLDDRWVQGGSNPDAYAIWHWQLMDVFVYFSHHLVTLPPPCWTNAAHAHGVRVLGTFLTEWDEGRAICRRLLSSKEFARMYAERLAEVAAKLGFDGWLVNMENELDMDQIPILEEFISHLTQTMHASVPGSLIIWYDSVTKDGQLRWQDALNMNNKPFFDLCDGIFVNYTWKESYPKLSAAAAGDRKFDVYMGIDIFGRNTYGGGQWKTNVALELLRKEDVSAAIFAPGWVYETKQPPDFQAAQNRWWGLVEKSWGILQNYPKALPFYSNFDQGHGYHFSIEGSKVADEPWNNISCQSIQPVVDTSMDSVQTPIEVQLNFKSESYSGGGNITFTGSLNDDAMFKARLFLVELPLEDLPIHISYSVSSEGSSILGLLFGLTSNNNGGRVSILLAAGGLSFLPANLLDQFDQVITPSLVIKSKHPTAPGWILHEGSIEMRGHTLTEIFAVCYMKAEHYSNEPAPDQERHLRKGSTAAVASSTFYAALGHISIKTSQNEFPHAASWKVGCENISWTTVSDGTKTVSTKITWKLKTGDTSSFMWYNIFVKKLAKKTDDDTTVAYGEDFLGLTRMDCYYVADLKVPAVVAALVFIIQLCGLDGSCQKLNESPRFELAVED